MLQSNDSSIQLCCITGLLIGYLIAQEKSELAAVGDRIEADIFDLDLIYLAVAETNMEYDINVCKIYHIVILLSSLAISISLAISLIHSFG